VFDELGMREGESRLARMDPGYRTASTASRLDAFLLPDSIHFAEYNAESPAGPGYTQRLCELFDALPVMQRFREGYRVRFHRTIDALLAALVASYREWGGRATSPTMAIVDWHDVPTWTEFEILAEAFTSPACRRWCAIRGTWSSAAASWSPRLGSCPAGRPLTGGRMCLATVGRPFMGRRMPSRHGTLRIDLVYRRVLINDIVDRPDECAALVRAYEARAVCVANTFQCKLPHKKAFFAVLTDPRTRGCSRRPSAT
jgi:hypothetical protein